MAIQKKENTTEQKKEVRTDYEVKVLKVTPRQNREGCYRFNAEVNGITIYGMEYITYTAKGGDQRSFVTFPQYQSSDGKYYNHVYFLVNDPLNTKCFGDIERQIEELL